MSRFTEPMFLAWEPGQPRIAPTGGEEGFWARLEARGVKITRAAAPPPQSVQPGDEQIQVS